MNQVHIYNMSPLTPRCRIYCAVSNLIANYANTWRSDRKSGINCVYLVMYALFLCCSVVSYDYTSHCLSHSPKNNLKIAWLQCKPRTTYAR